MAADVTIKKHATFREQVTLSLSTGGAVDVTNYTSYKAKLRNRAATPDQPTIDFLKTAAFITVTVATVVGDNSKLELSIANTVTDDLDSTEGYPDARLPVIDIEMTEVASPNDVVVLANPLTVAIEESYAHD